MFDGDITNDSYATEKLRDPRILAFMSKITVIEDPAFAKPPGNAPSTRFTAALDDGRKLVRQVDNMPSFPGQPMSRADVERKFRGNVCKVWPAERTAAILEALWALERTPDVRALLGQLALPR
jgi:2-methylcitrate dehydratase